VILLDTHALIWMAKGHRRARPLAHLPRLYVSPTTVLELQVLAETGRVRFAGGGSPTSLAADERWRLDEPPSGKWFATACDIQWTRDPFDRLLVAHARLRGWRLATADEMLLGRMTAADVLAL
jgi:PIN domain nuclease of toxin-antitoxin system